MTQQEIDEIADVIVATVKAAIATLESRLKALEDEIFKNQIDTAIKEALSK